jgi:hypothetical protein
MAATNFEIIVDKYKGDTFVGRIIPATLGASPDAGDAMEDIFSSVVDGILGLILAAVNINIWGVLAAAVISSVSPAAGGIAWTLVAVDQFITTIKETNLAVLNAVNDVTNGSNWVVNTSADLNLEESDEFDKLNIRFHAYGDDEFPVWRTIFIPEQVVLDSPVYQTIGENNHIIDCWVNPNDLLEGGVYPFIFGARDDGFYFDVAGVCQLNLKLTKKTKPLCSTLKSMNEHINPVNPLRSLRETTDILGVESSLRAAFEELARCRLVQALPVRLYWQNAALMPSDLIDVHMGDLLGLKSVKLLELFDKDLYEGRDRNAALNAFISYLRMEQPDIAGFCEFWVPEERLKVYASLRDIYPYDDFVPNMFFLQGPIGDTPGGVNMMDGGLMLLSRFPILASDKHIYQAAYAEDAFSAKGILYAAIGIPGFPTPVHVFLTHLQNCPSQMGLPEDLINGVPNIGGDCRSKQNVYQVKELYSFIQSKAGAGGACIIMGDFNISSRNADDSSTAEFRELRPRLGEPEDGWVDGLRNDNCGAEFYWPGLDRPQEKPDKHGKTCGGENSFVPESAGLAWDACKCEGHNMDCSNCPKDGSLPGFQFIRLAGGSLVDHIFTSPGPTINNGTHIHFGRRRVVHVMLDSTKDASNHCGLRVDIQSIRVRAG